ncbi:methylenetetrahydrofolate reductase [Desulfobulbus oligotrophicus]|jgi:methylenetetrahydrofolate reductase (NADPH)|uniref:Methylenetetrahydrofolate reductase n=1 Tax=Desulfobulbus oligotrophicus TaxID=1909699 RepID=A0A7T6AQ81_9BACT|nr:methylenetetrahydrofolate reductase [Desulfobulbus oligotrophicus]MDY0391198.1 methylenetetrahydrofolate reductase [Desulfobulbus oligotrophicus]QQG65268.1 methylenetetrahydrofolate reductase [Desulfobulbus oligotrophicus]
MQIPQLIHNRSPFVSLEFFPPKKQEQWPAFLEAAGELGRLQPLFVSVTYGAGGSTQSNTLEICEQLIRTCGFEVMPHLTGVTADTGKIDGFLTAVKALGIDNVLALRGDRPTGYSGTDAELFAAFPHAADLVAYIRRHHPELAIGVAGFPEAHAEARSIAEDLTVMCQKVECGADFVITQLYFDNRVYFDYVERLRALGITVPVIPGILPVRNLTSLRFVLEMCNARIPGRLINALTSAHEEGGADAVYEIGVAYAREQIKGLLDGGAPGVHLYTLNQADMCLAVMDGLL